MISFFAISVGMILYWIGVRGPRDTTTYTVIMLIGMILIVLGIVKL